MSYWVNNICFIVNGLSGDQDNKKPPPSCKNLILQSTLAKMISVNTGLDCWSSPSHVALRMFAFVLCCVIFTEEPAEDRNE